MVRTSSQTRLPTPVALSNTMREGTPPMYSKAEASPWQTHSAVSPPNTCAMPTLEYGNDSTKKLRRRLTPPTLKSASPKSAWAVPGGQSRSRNPSPSRPRSALSILTYSRTVDSATSTPSSSVSLTNILWAVWRCFLQALRSSSRYL